MSFKRVTACGRSFIIVSIIFDAEGSVTNDTFTNKEPQLIAGTKKIAFYMDHFNAHAICLATFLGIVPDLTIFWTVSIIFFYIIID